MILDDLSQLPNYFKTGYRGILLLHRNKDGAVGNAQRMSIKMITSCPEEWDICVQHLRDKRNLCYPNHRIYASVNERNIDKAIHEFQRRQLEFTWSTQKERNDFYIDVENRFFSCLMNPNSRNSSNLLIDCDTPEEYLEFYSKLTKDIILYEYPTKNGRHIITKPFNPNEIKVPFKKDELMYIG